ncbi:MAG: arginine repressor [Negativibacillus massiliensis]|uniref:arginine repressor n=1 Tax=Negativibacillus massiliensis TaxID=1871035 RepID=UPI000339C76D|nr:arginine repressor [Negativibacillus massiliensis]MBS5139035.1 arginine repressor [Clostridium sp.]MCI6347471.1 arginine repressor [Negativibacillus massiliensis]MDY4048252.1 arginine repressor [Negativibacillus massiliensis]CDA75684.1 arginine repressor [Clostridium sp. CAG:242]
MKLKRHAKILELISESNINTQEELQDRLNQEGFSVTQATVSRDIKELRLIKTLASDGTYHYTTHADKNTKNDLSFKFHAIFSEAVHSVDYAQNLVVVKCYTGMANAACAALDSIHWKGLVGTIAGDDTILLVMKDETFAQGITDELNKLAAK